MNQFKKLFKSLPTNMHQLVFYSPSPKYKVISNTVANKLLRNILNDLGIEPITVHGLRHTHVIKELKEEDEIRTTNVFDKMVV